MPQTKSRFTDIINFTKTKLHAMTKWKFLDVVLILIGIATLFGNWYWAIIFGFYLILYFINKWELPSKLKTRH